MQEGKTYVLRLDLRSVTAEAVLEGATYTLRVTKDTLERTLPPMRAARKGELAINENVELRIPGGELRRESKCKVVVVAVEGGTERELGRFQFLVMNYKNYSKNAFKLMQGDHPFGVINMSINISSSESIKSSKPTKKDEKKVAFQEPVPQLPTQSQKSIPPEITVHAPAEEIKLVCPSEVNREPKSMFSAFGSSGIVIVTKKEVAQEQRRRSEKKPLSSMGELFEKKSGQEATLRLPNDPMIKSCRLSPSRLHNPKDSRYSREIQENLDNLSALDHESNILSSSRSPLKGEEDFCIFDTLHRMKDKFEKIHEHEGFLNDEPLDELTEVNEEETEERDKIVATDVGRLGMETHHEEIEIKRARSHHEPVSEMERSIVINMGAHSAVSHLSGFSSGPLHITRTVEVLCRPIRRPLRMSSTPGLHFTLSPHFSFAAKQCTPGRRYKLALTTSHNPSTFEPEVPEAPEAIKQPPNLTQSYLNFEIEEESLQRFSYIKLNKISHLSRAADISKRRNNFLIKANEQLKVAQRLAEQKLQVSRKIISEKEDLLTHEFDSLREHMRVISSKLTLKNEESLAREQKVRSLQAMLEQYARDINALKDTLKTRNNTIRDLKCLLSLKDDADTKTPSNKREELVARNLREAMLEELGISKNLREVLEGRTEARIEAPREELLFSKNLRTERETRREEGETRRQERRGTAATGGVDLLAQLLQSDERNSNPNSTSKTFLQERRVRKYSSIENTVQHVNEEADKSADITGRTFRKFSHSKNNSMALIEPRPKQQTSMDLVFEKLTGLFSGDSNARVLKNL